MVRLRWLYNNPDITDSFNAYITNVNAPVIPSGTSDSVSITSPGFSISSATGTVGPPAFPTTPSLRRFLRRAPGEIARPVIVGQPAVVENREILWAVQVPVGWYKLIGESTTSSSGTTVADSGAFEITAGDTACFTDGTVPTTSQGSNQPEQTAIVPGTGGAPNKTGIIAGAVVGSLVGLAAIFGVFFMCVLRRKAARNQSSRPADAWGSVDSKDSRFRGMTGLPPGTPNRLSRNAEAMVAGRDLESDSFEEKGSSGGHSGNFSPEPPVFRRHSQSSQAMVLGPLSTRESRRSTLQSIPTNVTPTNATPIPSPYPHSDGHESNETAVASLATTGATTTRSNSVAKKPTRKPVPTYRPDSAQTPSKRNSEEDIPEADLGAQMISHSQRSDTVLLNAFPFEMEGAREVRFSAIWSEHSADMPLSQVHYLIPDPPAPPRR